MQEWDNTLNYADLLQILFFGLVFFGSLLVMVSYVVLALTSINLARVYIKFNTDIDFKFTVRLAELPKISIIAPAYNEELHILSNIRSLLSLHYPNFEVIVVNDGSKDNTLEKIIDGFELEKMDGELPNIIQTKPVRGVYRTKSRDRNNLLVIDKENGGKADALNVGINASNGQYVVNIDVDSVLDKKSLLKLVKPMLREKDKKVIAAGGVIRVANDCNIKSGQVKDVHLPKKIIGALSGVGVFKGLFIGENCLAAI